MLARAVSGLLGAEQQRYSMTNMKSSVNTQVIRGKESWNYIYIFLGFAISIEATVIGMITPLLFPYNLLAFAATAAITFNLFLFNSRFQNKLIGLKNRYEDKPW